MTVAPLPCSTADALLPHDSVDATNALAARRKWSFTCYRDLDFEASALRATLALWQSKATHGRLPARADLSMRDLKHVLRDMIVLDIVRDGGQMRFRCRNIGSHAVSLLGEVTGRFMDEA